MCCRFNQPNGQRYKHLQCLTNTLWKYILWWIYWYWFGILDAYLLPMLLVKFIRHWLLTENIRLVLWNGRVGKYKDEPGCTCTCFSNIEKRYLKISKTINFFHVHTMLILTYVSFHKKKTIVFGLHENDKMFKWHFDDWLCIVHRK
jgi:hypothetical protein